MKRMIGALMVGALVAMTGAVATAKPADVSVCHYDDDGIESAPVTVVVGSQKSAAQHVANHTEANGHEGNDFLGSCTI